MSMTGHTALITVGVARSEELAQDELPSVVGLQPGHRADGGAVAEPAGQLAPMSPASKARLHPGGQRCPRPLTDGTCPSSGGTALPICLKARRRRAGEPEVVREVWSRAASRTVRVRCCSGWMYQ